MSVKLGKAVPCTLKRYTESKGFSAERFKKLENQYTPTLEYEFGVLERHGHNNAFGIFKQKV